MDGTPFLPCPVTVAGWRSAPCRPTALFRALSVGGGVPSLRPLLAQPWVCQPVPAGVTPRPDGEAVGSQISLKLGRMATLARAPSRWTAVLAFTVTEVLRESSAAIRGRCSARPAFQLSAGRETRVGAAHDMRDESFLGGHTASAPELSGEDSAQGVSPNL